MSSSPSIAPYAASGSLAHYGTPTLTHPALVQASLLLLTDSSFYLLIVHAYPIYAILRQQAQFRHNLLHPAYAAVYQRSLAMVRSPIQGKALEFALISSNCMYQYVGIQSDLTQTTNPGHSDYSLAVHPWHLHACRPQIRIILQV